MKILIVEDDANLGTAIKKYLSQDGYLIESANNFIKASEKVADYDYDCVLVDITLPNGNGLELVKQLKQNNSKAGIIIISAKTLLMIKLMVLI